MRTLRSLIIALGLSLVLLLTSVPAAFATTASDAPYMPSGAATAGSTSFYLKIINPPAGATMWCGDWFWNPIGPLGLDEVAHVVNVPSQGDPSIPYSDHLWIIIKNQFGESFLQYNEHHNFVALDGQLYVFDCRTKTLTEQAPEVPSSLEQPMTLASFGFRVANMPAGADRWSVTTLTPFGERVLYTSGRLAAADVVSITDTPAVNCLLVQTYSQGTTSSQYFDWFTGRNGVNYIYDFSTTRITESSSRPAVTTSALPSGTTGIPYSQALAASGGAGGYIWSVASGDFPDWAQLDASTGEITGVPDTSGRTTFVAQVADRASATDAKTLSLEVNPPGPEIAVTAPAGGESFEAGSTQTVTWTSSGITGKVKIQLSRNGGATWKTIISSTPNDGSQAWTVSGPATDQARIRVVSLRKKTVLGVSDASFTILQSITLNSPNGGEEWPVGSTQNLAWTSVGITGNVRIQLSRNGGTTWKTIVSRTPNDGSHMWTVKRPATDRAQIKIVSVKAKTAFDVSEASFRITPQPAS